MAEDIKFAVAVLNDGSAHPMIYDPDKPRRHALKPLGTAVPQGYLPGMTDAEQQWHDSSYSLLVDLTSQQIPHVVSAGAGNEPSPVEAKARPWYVIFEGPEHGLWVGRFFAENIPGNAGTPGVFIVEELPALVDGTTFTDQMRPLRSVILTTRTDISDDAGSARDHGGGGGEPLTHW